MRIENRYGSLKFLRCLGVAEKSLIGAETNERSVQFNKKLNTKGLLIRNG